MTVPTSNEKLFTEFPPISTEQWEALILEDLKGADYEKKLIWKTIENLKFKPYYREEDIKEHSLTETLPCHTPFTRGNKTGNEWFIREHIQLVNPVEANKKATEALKRGAESLALNVSGCKRVQDMVLLLKGIDIEKVNIHYYGASSYLLLADLLVRAINELGFDSRNAKGSFNFDNLGYFLAHNKFYASLDSNFIELSQLIDIAKRDFPDIKIINVNAHRISNDGGSLTQEIAYALAIGNEYLTQLTSKGQDADDVLKRMQFSFATGSNYFLEIAKLRAARMLWSAITQQYKPVYKSSSYMYIHSISTLWNKTVYDPYVNILRNTTEAMSAAIGGCDSMTLLPFDITYKASDDFTERISRNIQILLKEESYFNKVADVSAGSYYIENLTDIIAEASWQLFLDIEKTGGFIAHANSGKLTQSVEEYALKKQQELATRRQFLLGTNQFPNYTEKMLDKLEPKTDVSGLKAKKEIRLAQAFEALRLSTEDYVNKGNPVPKVFLFNFGNLAFQKARAGFSLNFFACAGYDVIDNNGFKNINDGITAAINSHADIIVLCSSDDEYASTGVEIVKSLKKAHPDKMIIIAGNPPEATEMLKQAGVDDFIHIRTNVLDSLTGFSRKLGII